MISSAILPRRGGIDFSHQQDTTRHNTYIEYSLPLLAEAADLQEELTGERPHVVEDNHSQSYTPLSSRLNFCDLTWLGVPDYQE